MRRSLLVLFAMVLLFGLVPTAAAVSDSPPHASSWEQTDTMGAWVELGARSRCVDESWIQSHNTFFRGGTGDEVPADRFENAGVFEAVENGSTTHSGQIWWIASGRTKEVSLNPLEPCNLEYAFPVKGEFHGKGAMRITESDGPTSRVGTTCSLRWAIHLTGDPTFVSMPPVTWGGNFVAQCDDGATIHLHIDGPTPGSGLEPGGIEQSSHGIVLDQ